MDVEKHLESYRRNYTKDLDIYIERLAQKPVEVPYFHAAGLRFYVQNISMDDILNETVRKLKLKNQANILWNFICKWLEGRHYPNKRLFAVRQFRKFDLLPPTSNYLPELQFTYDKKRKLIICYYQKTVKGKEQQTLFFELRGTPEELRIFMRKIRFAYKHFAEFNARFIIKKSGQ